MRDSVVYKGGIVLGTGESEIDRAPQKSSVAACRSRVAASLDRAWRRRRYRLGYRIRLANNRGRPMVPLIASAAHSAKASP